MHAFRPGRARLCGVRAMSAANTYQPMLVEGAGTACGLILRDVGGCVWRRLRFFEEPEYFAREVLVMSNGGADTLRAVTFWPSKPLKPDIALWSLARWRRKIGRRALAAAQAYMALMDRTDIDLDAAWAEIVERFSLAPI